MISVFWGLKTTGLIENSSTIRYRFSAKRDPEGWIHLRQKWGRRGRKGQLGHVRFWRETLPSFSDRDSRRWLSRFSLHVVAENARGGASRESHRWDKFGEIRAVCRRTVFQKVLLIQCFRANRSPVLPRRETRILSTVGRFNASKYNATPVI